METPNPLTVNLAIKRLPPRVKTACLMEYANATGIQMDSEEIASSAHNLKSQVMRNALAYMGFLV